MARSIACAMALSAALVGSAARQGVDDPAIRAAVERFFAVQEAEDIPGYLALWSSTVPQARMQQLPVQLKYIFDSGDDKFSGITITRVAVNGDELRVRVNATRDRTSTRRQPDGTPVVTHSALQTSLTFVREGGALKLLREGSAADDLAAAYLAAATAVEREALLAAEPELVNEYFVTAVSRQADFAAQSNQYARALEIYTRALEIARRVNSRRMEGDVLQNVANARYFLRDYPGALQSYDERLAIVRELGNDEGIASSLFGIGTVKYLTYDYNAALASYEEALAIQTRLADEPAIAATLVSTGNVRYLQADYEAAAADYRRSRDLQRKMGNAEGEARALEGLGRVSAAEGDYAAALEAYTSVLQDAKGRGNRAAQGTALQSLGEVQFRLGNFDTARALFDESRTHYEAIGDSGSVGRVWQEIALTDLISRRFAPAEQEYGRSRTACESGRPDRDCVARAIVGLAFAQASQEHFADAIQTYRKAIDAFSALNKPEEAARAEVGLAQAQYGSKDIAGALATAAHAEQQAITLGASDVVWRARVAVARAERRAGAAEKAIAAAQAAVASVRQIAAAALEHPADRIASDTTAAYAFLALLQAEAGDAAAAFTTLEERWTHALRVELLANERDIVRGMTADERLEERKAAAALVAIQKQIDAERALPKPDAARIDRLKQSLETATADRARQQQRLFERLPDLRAWRGVLSPATADAAAGLLTPEDVLVEFVIDDDDVLAVVAARAEDRVDCRAYASTVARTALAERIARAVEPATLRATDVWRKAAVELQAVLPAGALERLAAAKRAIVIPDDVLWRVPFEALPVKAGVLADQTTVVYAASLTSLVKAPAAPSGDRAAGVLAVGAPDLPASVRDRIRSTSPGWVLRSAETAAAELQALAPPAEESGFAALTGEAANEPAVRAQAPPAAAIHVAAPFRINSASPLFSPILLSQAAGATGGADSAADGALEAREIANLDLHARVAVLSDGEAATMRDAAAAFGTIQWVWRAAGVPSLVLSKWADDESAGAALVAELHKGLRSGQTPETALHNARAAIRARGETSAPFFWAGWMIVGRLP